MPAVAELFLLTCTSRALEPPYHVCEPQQLSSDMKGGFYAAWCCRCLQSLPGCVTSFAPAPDFSECLVQRGERKLCCGRCFSLPPDSDRFGVVFLPLPWKRCLQSQKGECVWHSAAVRCGEERACILPTPSSRCGEKPRIQHGGQGREEIRL